MVAWWAPWPMAGLSPGAPLWGITPIGDMLEVMRRSMEAPSDSAGWSPMAEMASAAGTPLEIDLPAHLADVESPTGERLQTGRSVRLEPLGAPVWLAGATPAAEEVLRDLLGPIGFLAVGASGGDAMGETLDAGASAPDNLLRPGASLGVRFVDGDLSATAIGTLTYVDGERLVGFGHRLIPLGGVDMPMTGAHIYEVLPSIVSSFKIGAGTYPIGALRQDHFSGVAGLIGAEARMLPIEVKVRSSGGERVYGFRLLRHVAFTAGLANAVLLTAMESQATVFGASTLKVEAAFRLRCGEWMRHSQVYGGPGAAFAAARDAIEPLAHLMRSSFDGLEVDSLRFDVSVGEGMETARVTSIRLDRPVCRPGDEVVCRVTVEPYRSAPVERIFRLTVPRDLDPGRVVIRVGSGLAAAQWALDRQPDAFQPRDADHLLELLTRDQRSDELVVEMSRQELGVSIGGRLLPGLPASARAALRESHGSGRMQTVFGRVVGQRRLELPYVLTGEHSVELSVRRR